MTHPPRIFITPEHVDGQDHWDAGDWTTTEGMGVPYEPSPQWRPIEAAPDEGSVIGRNGNEVRTTWLVNYHHTGPRWTYEALEGLFQWKPTHWIPLSAIAEATK